MISFGSGSYYTLIFEAIIQCLCNKICRPCISRQKWEEHSTINQFWLCTQNIARYTVIYLIKILLKTTLKAKSLYKLNQYNYFFTGLPHSKSCHKRILCCKAPKMDYTWNTKAYQTRNEHFEKTVKQRGTMRRPFHFCT